MNMEEKCACGNGTCSGGKCCAGMHGSMCHGHLLKKIVTIVVMIFIFWLGLQLGELRTLTRMEQSRSHMMMMGSRDGMMGGMGNDDSWNAPDQSGTVAPGAAATQ